MGQPFLGVVRGCCFAAEVGIVRLSQVNLLTVCFVAIRVRADLGDEFKEALRSQSKTNFVVARALFEDHAMDLKGQVEE